MNYSLLPFPCQPLAFDETPHEPYPDIRESLHARHRPKDEEVIANVDLRSDGKIVWIRKEPPLMFGRFVENVNILPKNIVNLDW